MIATGRVEQQLWYWIDPFLRSSFGFITALVLAVAQCLISKYKVSGGWAGLSPHFPNSGQSEKESHVSWPSQKSSTLMFREGKERGETKAQRGFRHNRVDKTKTNQRPKKPCKNTIQPARAKNPVVRITLHDCHRLSLQSEGGTSRIKSTVGLVMERHRSWKPGWGVNWRQSVKQDRVSGRDQREREFRVQRL